MYLVHAGDLYVALRLYAILVNSTLTRMGNVPSDQWEAIVRNGTLLLSTIPETFSASAQQTNIDGKNLKSIRLRLFLSFKLV